MPAILYVAGYCAHAAAGTLSCPDCLHNLVANSVLETELVLKHFTPIENAEKFYKSPMSARCLER